MTIKTISLRLEISFWRLAINLLSESTFFQNLVTWFYRSISLPLERLSQMRVSLPPARWALLRSLGLPASAGLALGFLSGLLSSLALS
jgi:hypothetical protein